MGQSTLYALNDVVLEFHSEGLGHGEIDRLLEELSWAAIRNSSYKPALHLSVRSNSGQFSIPQICREVLRTDDFVGFELDDNFFLTDGSSVFHLRLQLGKACAWVVPGFFRKPVMTQANFWCFGLLKLLRPLGIYSLHAAALASETGEGVLLVGPSGSGKSTLAIGLIRQGWRYLSDDAVLLRHESVGVKALSCRRSFYIDSASSGGYSDLSLGDEEPDSTGGRRRRLGINETYPEQYVPRCLPRIVIFPQITGQNRSTLKPIDKIVALRFLLAQSAPQLFDRGTMEPHLELLKNLLQQTQTYELNAGSDLYREPSKLVDLIQEARGEGIAANRH